MHLFLASIHRPTAPIANAFLTPAYIGRTLHPHEKHTHRTRARGRFRAAHRAPPAATAKNLQWNPYPVEQVGENGGLLYFLLHASWRVNTY